MGLDFKFDLTWQHGEKRGSLAVIHRPFEIAIRDWSRAFLEIAEAVLAPHVHRLFASEGAAEGEPWQELAPATVKRRGSAHPILQVTGALLRSFQTGGERHHEEITPRKLTWGSDVPYALFHEFGTRGRFNPRQAGARALVAKTLAARERYAASQAHSSGLPPRPMLVYSPRLADDITSRMTAHMALMARRAGYKILGRQAEGPVAARLAGMIALGGRG
jgi:phage gpG-like protein